MARDQLVEWLEGIVFGGVAITTAALDNATDGNELTFTQWRAVLLVGNGEDGARVGEVARFLHSALPATSRLLRRLERRGLLSLERDEHDRRATRARLTAAGLALRSAVLQYRRDEIAAIVATVKPSTAGERVLRDLAAGFDARGHAGSPSNRRGSPSDPER